jgi:hypothetical protein
MKEPLVDVGKALLEENVFMILLFVAVGIGETSDSLPLDVPSPGVLL